MSRRAGMQEGLQACRHESADAGTAAGGQAGMPARGAAENYVLADREECATTPECGHAAMRASTRSRVPAYLKASCADAGMRALLHAGVPAL